MVMDATSAGGSPWGFTDRGKAALLTGQLVQSRRYRMVLAHKRNRHAERYADVKGELRTGNGYTRGGTTATFCVDGRALSINVRWWAADQPLSASSAILYDVVTGEVVMRAELPPTVAALPGRSYTIAGPVVSVV